VIDINIIDKAKLDFVNDTYNVSLWQLRNMPYNLYLQTDHWQHFRLKALDNAKYICQLCNSKEKKLDVHHRTYENRGRETFNDVIVLCDGCHKKHHGKDDQELPEDGFKGL
jgi:5-methylcytosine-specific restriction endonuclease McrA